ncbi:hypothetical protein BJ138DRAFT_1154377 [Hygrophoropsis aurantiaca]|uniref:Uncharacterized protein n=1 Tax=Hygrophoropsis aurantiaca TaxID=72124 RepID=A0ACB8A996_9AGAM|nr:hypothetical protein BJ138DRAFT_1154377 [Hygrophoropsis aurantiaca]
MTTHTGEEPNAGTQQSPTYPPSGSQTTRADVVPQQASTSPGDGGEVEVPNASEHMRDVSGNEVDPNDPNINVVMVGGEQQKPSFKDQVVRGTPEVKEHGEKVLRGEDAPKKRRGSQ